MDAGIISSLKCCYRSFRYRRVLDEEPIDGSDFYSVDKLTEMKGLITAWNDVPVSVIDNLWMNCGIVRNNSRADMEVTTAAYVQQQETVFD